jgi:NADH-quinone oxidoreductase subunit H
MGKGMSYIYYLIIYGFLLTAALGFLMCWLDRKITARLQYRVGPPLLQPLIDIVKLLGKETIVPRGASKTVFLASPLIGLAAAILVSTILWEDNISPAKTYLGDLIVVIYLLVVVSKSIILGGFASKNPLASLGASREMKLMLGYELPFVLAIMVAVIKSNFSIRLGDIIRYQVNNGAVALSLSGVLAVIVAIICMQAKLGLVPFDIPEAETEIISGPLIEYSGTALAIYRLMKNMLLFVLPFFITVLFMGGLRFDGIQILYSLLKVVGLLLAITVIRNTNPRVRIDQAIRFFWGPMTAIAIIAVILALRGR